MRPALPHTLAVLALLIATGCSQTPPEAPMVAHVSRLTIEASSPGAHACAPAYAEDACDPASEAWAIDIARRVVQEREDPAAWPYGADYLLIRRSAVQWWIIARRITDPAGEPRFPDWDRGIVIDELGNVMFYVPAR